MVVLQQAEIEQIEKSERVGGAQQHKRVTAALNKQIQLASERMKEVNSQLSEDSVCWSIVCWEKTESNNCLLHVFICITASHMNDMICILCNSVQSFYFMGTNFHGLMMMDMFEDTSIRGFVDFQIKYTVIKFNQHFLGILNSTYTKINVQRIKMIS